MSASESYMDCEYFVEGMHCAGCELLIEKNLSEHPLVRKVNAVLSKGKVFLQLKSNADKEAITAELNQLIDKDGYSLVASTSRHEVDWSGLLKGLIIASVVMALFLLIQRLGIVNWVSTDQLNIPFIFLIGVIASLSTCMAVVGGLVLSISGSYAKEKQFRPLAFFHASRLISFFILGGLIGLLGSAFVLTPASSFILNLILFVVMLILGLNMLDISPRLRRFQLKLPKSLGRNSLKLESTQNVFTPVLLGAVTFILPCGFTQSMQIYSLSTGSFLNGAVTMLVFALGTLPVLALISFASVKLSKTLQSGIFFKSAGFIVLFFALFNFTAALVAVGLIQPIFNL